MDTRLLTVRVNSELAGRLQGLADTYTGGKLGATVRRLLGVAIASKSTRLDRLDPEARKLARVNLTGAAGHKSTRLKRTRLK